MELNEKGLCRGMGTGEDSLWLMTLCEMRFFRGIGNGGDSWILMELCKSLGMVEIRGESWSCAGIWGCAGVRRIVEIH